MRRVGFLLGCLLILAAAAILVWDLAVPPPDGGWRPHKLGSLWAALDSTSLQLLQAGVERHLAVWLWDGGIAPVLQWPALPIFLIPGLLLFWFCRPRRSRKFYRSSSR